MYLVNKALLSLMQNLTESILTTFEGSVIFEAAEKIGLSLTCKIKLP